MVELRDFTAGGCERPLPLLVHDRERKRDPEPDSAFVRARFNTGVAVPAFIRIRNERKRFRFGTEKHVARTDARTVPAATTFFPIYYRRHNLTSTGLPADRRRLTADRRCSLLTDY